MCSGVAGAQTYPSRTITFVVPFPPGGSTSLVGRVIADRMSQLLGQSIIVDNRGGAGGTVGAKAVANEATPKRVTAELERLIRCILEADA